jgi:glycosyltransferase involved in cell wall biosynthesis
MTGAGPDGRPARVGYLLGTAAGGTVAHVTMLATELAGRGWQVGVYGPMAAGGAPGVAFEPVDIGSSPRPGRDARAVRRLAALLARDRPDILHAHGLRAAAAASLAALPRVPLVVTVHNAPPHQARSRAIYWLLAQLAARRAAVMLVVSADLIEPVLRAGARWVALAVVAVPAARPPSAEEIAAVRASLAAPGRPVVLAAGRLAAQKGLGTLIAAAAAWNSQPPGQQRTGGSAPRLVIAGDGPLRAELQRRAGRAGLDALFLGQRADVPALLAAADVAVVPSLWEGQPLIVGEALRAGAALVASRTGGIPALTGESAALLVRPGDAAALGTAIRAVLDDAALAAGLRAAARSRAATLPSPADAARAVLTVYQRALTGR